ncbi:hypothetical protein TCAL_00391 [Tigriopus californicus]|uniref:Tetraspanin n=1 Tax=Tigriopus californicus TaxID=6832 RepID=A0A553NE24_TIGCA|nr:CD151 antigen-like [Tigriopus californicus]TRY63696.1 hypothetical protein TCAL_00391 [Tigriopus californicus]|eukprot:TCALIF_00391-PA protein Name:"Similar to CD151 CD151 antigen (Homo sapiens)" AED:0.00 eAED:0.00 QI:0/-1/0/1/-1/1/1/0/265
MKRVKEVEDDEVDGFECCTQWALLLFNLPLMLMGIALIILGVVGLTEHGYIADALQAENGGLFTGVMVLLIVVGALMMILAVIGCVAAFVESHTLLMIYYVSVLVAFLLIVIGMVLGYVYRGQLETTLRQELLDTMPSYDPEKPQDSITLAWDKTQGNLECCGVAKGEERPWKAWLTNQRLNSGQADSRVPESCCLATSNANGQRANCNDGNKVVESLVYQQDCFTGAAQFLETNMSTLTIVCIFFALTLMVAAALSISLYILID